jgi:hypothetical protein
MTLNPVKLSALNPQPIYFQVFLRRLQVFATDIILSFFTAYYDQEVLITDHKLIARHYLRCGMTCLSDMQACSFISHVWRMMSCLL